MIAAPDTCHMTRGTQGFVDAHTHVLTGGLALGPRVDLAGAASREEVAARVAAAAAGLGPGEWVQGGGWDETHWRGAMPTSDWIDKVGGCGVKWGRGWGLGDTVRLADRSTGTGMCPRMIGGRWHGAPCARVCCCYLVTPFTGIASPLCISQTAAGRPDLLHRHNISTRLHKAPTFAKLPCCYTRARHSQPAAHTCDLPQRTLSPALPLRTPLALPRPLAAAPPSCTATTCTWRWHHARRCASRAWTAPPRTPPGAPLTATQPQGSSLASSGARQTTVQPAHGRST